MQINTDPKLYSCFFISTTATKKLDQWLTFLLPFNDSETTSLSSTKQKDDIWHMVAIDTRIYTAHCTKLYPLVSVELTIEKSEAKVRLDALFQLV